MDFVIVGIGYGSERIHVDAQDGDVPVLAAVLDMLHHNPGLAFEPELFLQPVGRDDGLLSRHGIPLARVNIGVIKEVGATGPAGDFIHLAEGFEHAVGGEPAKLDDLDQFVLFPIDQVLSEITPVGTAPPADDHPAIFLCASRSRSWQLASASRTPASASRYSPA